MDDNFFTVISRHIADLRKSVIHIVYFFLGIFAFFLLFGIHKVTIFGRSFLFLYPDVYRNMPSQLLVILEDHVLPAGTKLIIVSPTNGVVANVYIALFISLVVSMPVIVVELAKFIGPALKKSEKSLIKTITIPATILFTTGAFIGLWLIAPALFIIFKEFDIGVNSTPTMGISNFTSFLLLYMLSFGLAFETPVIMYGLTRAGMVSSGFWISHWRYAVIGALVFGWIFSPGVLGFTMIIMSIPIISLYFLGAYFSRRYEKKAAAQNTSFTSES